MTADDELVAFANARNDEDEAAADELHNRLDCDLDRLQAFGECSCGYPARMRREVEVKRRRLERYLAQDGYELPEGVHDGRDWDEREVDRALKDALETEVREDVAIWSDHPSYQQRWKP